MADLGAQQGRGYRPGASRGPASSSFQRDAAFSEIFGGTPPPGRSQTMTSHSPQFNQERAHTMTSHQSDPYTQSRGPPPPMRQSRGGYPPNPQAGYQNSQWQQPNGSGPPPQQRAPPPPHHQQRPMPPSEPAAIPFWYAPTTLRRSASVPSPPTTRLPPRTHASSVPTAKSARTPFASSSSQLRSVSVSFNG